MQENREMRVSVEYKDRRFDSGYKTEHLSIHTHEELEQFLLKNKKRTLIKIDIFYDTENYYEDHREWTVYRSLEEYLNRECKGFDASVIAKEKEKEKAEYNKKLIEEIKAEKNITVADNDEDGVTVIEYEGSDEVFCSWYRCIKCGCSDIMENFCFCPNCGRHIDEMR